MANKVYDKIKNFIKRYYKLIIIYVILILAFTVSLDYEVYSPGGLSDLSDRIKIDGSYEEEGSFNLTYVTAKKGIIPFILLSYIIPDWDLVSLDNSRIEDEDYEEILERGKIDLNSVNEYAIKVAYEALGKDYTISENNLTVYYVFEDAKTNLKVGDIIKEVDNKKITDSEELSSILNSKEVGDEVSFKVLRNGKTLERKGTLYESDDKKIIGLYLTNVIKIDTKEDIKFKYKSNESGASGGLMSTLEIYNKLSKEDITKGLTVAGTGTINYDGTVGEIGGVKYKLAGAVKHKADVFLVPSGNYEEAIKIQKEKNYKIKIIEATDFNSDIKELEKLERKEK